MADILDSVSQPVLPWGAISHISDQTGIPTQALADWHKHQTNPETPDWVPLVAGHSTKRSLPDSVESAIAANLRDNYIVAG